MPVNTNDGEDDVEHAGRLELDAREHHERQRHEAGDDERDAEALQALGHVRVAHFLADRRHGDDRDRPAGGPSRRRRRRFRRTCSRAPP